MWQFAESLSLLSDWLLPSREEIYCCLAMRFCIFYYHTSKMQFTYVSMSFIKMRTFENNLLVRSRAPPRGWPGRTFHRGHKTEPDDYPSYVQQQGWS